MEHTDYGTEVTVYYCPIFVSVPINIIFSALLSKWPTTKLRWKNDIVTTLRWSS